MKKLEMHCVCYLVYCEKKKILTVAKLTSARLAVSETLSLTYLSFRYGRSA